MPNFALDLKQSTRALRKTPGFTVTAVICIAVGIGATSTMFSLVDATLLRPLPFDDPERLVAVSERPPRYLRNTVSPPTYRDWREQNHVFEEMGATTQANRTLTEQGEPERLSGLQITASYLAVLRAKPEAGRLFSAMEEREPLVLISDRLWHQRFGGSNSTIGSAITLDGHPFTVIGIMPTTFRVLGDPDIWMPLPLDQGANNRAAHILRVFGRLKPGVTLEQANAEMSGIAGRISTQYPQTNAGWGVTIDPLRSYVVGTDLRTTALALFAGVGLLLLLSCANVANLLIVRGSGRAWEIGVRTALGASRGAIVRQMLVETLLFTLCGGLAGLWIASVLLEFAPRLLPEGTLPAAVALQLDARVVAFTVGACLFTALLSGLGPAWTSSAASLTGAIRSGGRSITSRMPVRNLLAGAQITLAVVLLAGAGLLVRTLLRLEGAERGYERGSVLTMRFSLPAANYPTPERAAQFMQSVEGELGGMPGIRAVGFSVDLPLDGWSFGEAFEVAGKPVPSAARPFAHFQFASPGYFDAVGIRMLRGRPFDTRDTAHSQPVCIVNEEFARKYLSERDPLTWSINTQGAARQVVGVIRQVKVQGPADANSVEIYVPNTQFSVPGMALAVRTVGSPRETLNTVKAAVARVDRNLAITHIRTLDEIADESVVRPRFRAGLAAAFGLAALVLAALGVYGVLAFTVSQRVREFGIRAALGASSGNLLWHVLGIGGRIAGAGVLVGVAVAAILTRSLASFLFDVKALDPVTFVVVPLLMIGVAAIACSLPARRAMGVDPVTVLRND